MLILCSIWVGAFPQNRSGGEKKYTVLLVHPTVGTLSSIQRLIEYDVFSIENYQFKGVYHFKEAYDYTLSEKFIQDNSLSVELIELKDPISSETLFRKNNLSDDFEKLFNESAGVLFFGGPDIPPYVYGEKSSVLTVITDPYRHYFEASFLFHLLGGYQDESFAPLLEKKPDYLVTGFCLGMQTMNIACGGTLIQDIPQEVYGKNTVEDILMMPEEQQHRNYSSNLQDSVSLSWASIHPIKAVPGSWFILEKILSPGQFPAVVSSHHQGIEKTGKGLKVSATSADGLIAESIDHERYPNVYAFQFHPEIPEIYNYDNKWRIRPTDPPESLRSQMERKGGYEFHLSLWKKIAGDIIEGEYYSSER